MCVKRIENDFMILKGENVKIECNVKSYVPVRSVTWQKEIDSEIIQINPSMGKYEMFFGNRPSLTINNFNADDPGKYRCIVINAVGLRNGICKSFLSYLSRFGWLTGFVTVLQHIPVFHTEDITLHNYVKIYKALLDHREDKTFIRPAICDTIDKQMQEHNIVVITGREGTGKSKICLELASLCDKKDYMVLKVDLSENHTVYTDMADTLLIIDDQHYTQNSLNVFMKHLPVLLENNIKVILTCRNSDLEIVRNVQEINKLKSEAFIDINSCLTSVEKEEMLRSYMKANNISSSSSAESSFWIPEIITDLSVQVTLHDDAIRAIRNEEPWKGYPLCASLFCSERKFLQLGKNISPIRQDVFWKN
ncbi:unnamed protein product [Mytilus edulis]|uniref:Ig-like domain-containing protein n=1 Tax=Mytilus edulis TaxID=6550 RepID=A0A8S3STS2_MYTED|nr:unnamed protein product [Mytilus edulis]